MRMKGRPTDAIKDTTVKVRLDDHMTGEIVQDDIILDSGSITDVLNSRDAFFDYIFGTENH